ncbi:MAG: glycosyltransferase family 2 protein [bacterium]
MNQTKSHWKYRRLFEILPAAITWSVILVIPVIASLFIPRIFAYYMIVFITYWLFKTFFMSYRLALGYINYSRDMKVNWRQKMLLIPGWQDIYHLVIVPTYKEDQKILDASIESVINSDYDVKKVIYVLATEERDRERAEIISQNMARKYGSKVGHFVSYMHPKDIPGEVIGKGGNISHACRQALAYFKTQKINFDKVIVTTMDSDNIMDRQYLSCLTYKYLVDPDPVHKSFQPIPMYFNNIWDVPIFARLIAMGSSAWQLIVATRPSRLRNFSAHAQSLAALIETDFWSTNTIVEDGHQYWRSYFHFNGNYAVVPMYTPIYQDAVLAGDMRANVREQYLQKRRWSWGVSDIPYVMEHTIGNKKIPFVDRWANALILWDAHISWSTTSIVLSTSSWLPILLNNKFRTSVLAFNFPLIYSRILTIAWLGMIVTLAISALLMPRYKGKRPIKKILSDWLLTPIVLPISNIIFSSLPALESQTRLALGKYLEYRVTIKSTKRSNIETKKVD